MKGPGFSSHKLTRAVFAPVSCKTPGASTQLQPLHSFSWWPLSIRVVRPRFLVFINLSPFWGMQVAGSSVWPSSCRIIVVLVHFYPDMIYSNFWEASIQYLLSWRNCTNGLLDRHLLSHWLFLLFKWSSELAQVSWYLLACKKRVIIWW